RQVADADARTLQVAENRDGTAHLFRNLAYQRDGRGVLVVRAVREVDSGDVHARVDETAERIAGRAGGAQRANDLCSTGAEVESQMRVSSRSDRGAALEACLRSDSDVGSEATREDLLSRGARSRFPAHFVRS